MEYKTLTSRMITALHGADRDALPLMLTEKAAVTFHHSDLFRTDKIADAARYMRAMTEKSERHSIHFLECTEVALPGGIYQVTAYYHFRLYEGDGFSEYYVNAVVLFYENKVAAFHLMFEERHRRKYTVECKEQTVFLREEAILYLEIIDKYLHWHCGDREYIERSSLKVKKEVMSDRFIPVRESHLVNIDHITGIKRYEITLSSGEQIQIPEKRYMEVKNRLMEWNGNRLF